MIPTGSQLPVNAEAGVFGAAAELLGALPSLLPEVQAGVRHARLDTYLTQK
jgi:hypothetical protein